MTQLPVRDGTAYGEIRAPLDKAKLIPYLEANVKGFKGPLDIQQFGVSRAPASVIDAVRLTAVRAEQPDLPPRDAL